MMGDSPFPIILPLIRFFPILNQGLERKSALSYQWGRGPMGDSESYLSFGKCTKIHL